MSQEQSFKPVGQDVSPDDMSKRAGNAYLEEFLLEWIDTPDWSTSMKYVQACPELLTDAAEQILTRLSQLQRDEQIQEILTMHAHLLQSARLHGVEDAYAALLPQQKPEHTLSEEMKTQAQVFVWLRISDWAEAHAYLQTHPRLLTDLAAQHLDQIRFVQTEASERKLISQRQALLRTARRWDIAEVSSYFHLAEQVEESGSLEQQALLSQLQAWIATHSWEESQIYLDAHPDLVSPVAESLLAALWVNQQEDTMLRVLLAQRLQLLQRVRAQGSVDAYRIPPTLASLNEVGIASAQQYQISGRDGDLLKALDCWQKALMLVLPYASERAVLLNNLGNGLFTRFESMGMLENLEAAITAFSQSLELTPFDSERRAFPLNGLSAALRVRYERTGHLADLEAAVASSTQAVEIASSTSPELSKYLNNLGSALRRRYEYNGKLEDLEAAITAFQQALERTPADAPERSRKLTNLGNGFITRYNRVGKLEDLEAAVVTFQQAVDASSPTSPERPMYLNNLGIGLMQRYNHAGKLEDLETAVATLQQAVVLAHPDSPRWPGHLASLGNGLHARYDRTGRREDLDAAITAYQQAVERTLTSAPERSSWLINLSNSLRTRYFQTEQLEDLEAAIVFSRQAVDLTPVESPEWALHLSNLGISVGTRFRHTKNLADLEEAILAFQQALEHTPSDSPDRAARVNNLGSGLKDRYDYTENLEDLEAAIAAYRQAVALTPPDAPERSGRLNNLGNALKQRYDHSRVLIDLDQAIAAWKTDWLLPASRFAALPVTYQLGHQQQQERRIAFLVTAYLERATQHQQDAATDRRAALEVVEGSKSRLLTQLVGRGTVGLPAGVPSVVATWERHLLAGLTELDSRDLATHDQMSAPEHTPERQRRLQQRQNMLQELEMLWGRIATVGSEGAAYVALRRGEAPQWQDLALLAENLGDRTALLSLYLTRERTIFFFLRAGWEVPRVIEAPLGQVAWSNFTERTFREVHRYQPGVRRGETWGHDLQPWLEAAQPGLKGVERLVLAPAGNGHLLPWGVLAERAGWTTPNGSPLPVITVPALGVVPRLRQRLHVTTGPALVVGNPTGDLPDAAEEARHVAERFATSPLIGAAATKKAIVPRLAEASLIHLAAHAFFNVQNPLDAGIVLADGVLTAREVLDYRLQADLLVLSACESGQTGSLGGEELAGLSQAFLQAGVRSLLVSLWRVNDTATAALMQSFYRAWQTGTDKALALRQAMTQIQQDPRWGHPHYWGAFILVGDWD